MTSNHNIPINLQGDSFEGEKGLPQSKNPF